MYYTYFPFYRTHNYKYSFLNYLLSYNPFILHCPIPLVMLSQLSLYTVHFILFVNNCKLVLKVIGNLI